MGRHNINNRHSIKRFPSLIISTFSQLQIGAELLTPLIAMADQYLIARRTDLLLKTVNLMHRLPSPTRFDHIARYYEALAINAFGSGNTERAVASLTDVVENCNMPLYQARALASLGVISARNGNNEEGLVHNMRSLRILGDNRLSDMITEGTHLLIAARLQSLYGDHKYSLKTLLEGYPRMLSFARDNPPQFHNYLNSLASESLECGQIESAQRIIVPVLQSPYISSYPEWHETMRDIHAALQPRPCIIGGCNLESRREAARLILVPNLLADDSEIKPPAAPVGRTSNHHISSLGSQDRVVPFVRPSERHRQEPKLHVHITLDSKETGDRSVVFDDYISNGRMEDAVDNIRMFHLDDPISPVTATIQCIFSSPRRMVFTGAVGDAGLDEIFSFCDDFRENEEIV